MLVRSDPNKRRALLLKAKNLILLNFLKFVSFSDFDVTDWKNSRAWRCRQWNWRLSEHNISHLRTISLLSFQRGKGSSINDVMVNWRRESNNFWRLSKTFVLKHVTLREGSKTIQNCPTLFMNNAKARRQSYKVNFVFRKTKIVLISRRYEDTR